MSEEKKKNKKANIVQNIRDINEKERQAAAEAEEKRREERRAREEAAKEAYERKLRQERIELMQMKQGVISEEESEITAKKEEEEPKKRTLKQKISSFIYLNKFGILMTAFFVFVAGILIYDLVMTKEADCAILYTPYNTKLEYNRSGMNELFTGYIDDYNDDGEVIFETYWICNPREMNNMNYEQVQATSTQLYAHFESGKAVLVMCDEWSYNEFGFDISLEDLTKRYPDSKFVTEKGIYLYDTNFHELIGVEKDVIPEDLILSVRFVREGESYTEEMQKNYDIGIAVLDKLMSELEYRG